MWKPVDTRFYAKRLPIAIAAIDDGGEANFIRTVLEQFNTVTLFHAIGTPGDFLQVIGQGEENAPPYLIISAHGDKGGLFSTNISKKSTFRACTMRLCFRRR
ncbi:hypothetical protein [Paenibacillus elgii]|uniref:hypothetical protein n=1 Tax=Paenibacillus elgii TaxID=189691 RepID=UPI00203D414A|nr:hypothetical protein [Paenibacillus elgii]MCM3267727.1 hypothetical protein [Paenibacillus elgii]